MYARATEVWQLLFEVVRLTTGSMQNKRRNIVTKLFWSAHQRFFKLMLMASKVPTCAELALEAVRNGMCVVIGLQSTGEANTTAVSGKGGRGVPPGLMAWGSWGEGRALDPH